MLQLKNELHRESAEAKQQLENMFKSDLRLSKEMYEKELQHLRSSKASLETEAADALGGFKTCRDEYQRETDQLRARAVSLERQVPQL